MVTIRLLLIDFKETQLWNFHAKQKFSELNIEGLDSLSQIHAHVYNNCFTMHFYWPIMLFNKCQKRDTAYNLLREKSMFRVSLEHATDRDYILCL